MSLRAVRPLMSWRAMALPTGSSIFSSTGMSSPTSMRHMSAMFSPPMRQFSAA